MAGRFDAIGRICQLAKERNVPLSRLTKQCGINPSTLNSCKKCGAQPRLGTIIKLCEGMEITLQEFFKVPAQP